MKSGKRIISIFLTVLILALPMQLVFAEEEPIYHVGDHIKFGTYPQSQVKDASTIEKLNAVGKEWISYNYYKSADDPAHGNMEMGDFMKYADLEYNGNKYRAVIFSDYRANSNQSDSQFNKDQIYYFKFEPLSWRVLDPSAGLVMCEKLIDSQPFQDSYYYDGSTYWHDDTKDCYVNNYAASSIRAWLKDSFYETAFTEEQKDNIQEALINNSNSNKTLDHIFLLSYDELRNPNYGFFEQTYWEDGNRVAQGTEYALCQGLWRCKISGPAGWDNSYWYTRTQGDSNSAVCYVTGFVYSDNVMTQREGGTIYTSGGAFSASYGVRPACYLYELKNDTEIKGMMRFPASYDYYRDSFAFANEGAERKLDYYSNMFAPGPALWWYSKDHEPNGLCFGYAYSTAAIYNQVLSLSDFKRTDANSISSIRDLELNSRLVLNSLSSDKLRLLESKKVGKHFTLQDYVIYNYIYQYTADNINERNQNRNNLSSLYQTVKDYVDSDRIGVTITFSPKLFKGSGSHEVLAIGIQEGNVIVDESNWRGSPQALIIEGDEFYYGPDNVYNSDNYNISFQTDYEEVFDRLTNNILLAKAPKKDGVNFGSNDDKFDVSDLLISIDADDYTIDKDVLEVIPAEGVSFDNSRVFWAQDSNNIQIHDLDIGGKVSVAMGKNILSTTVSSKSTVDLKIEEANSNILLQTKENSKTVLELSDVDEELNEYKIVITGTSNTDTILANKAEKGCKVSGLNDVTIEYIVNDEVMDEKSSNVSDGKEFNIIVDADENKISTDLEESHSHTDLNNDGRCDACGTQMTGGDHCKYCGKVHTGPFAWLVKFFHNIFAAFKRK